MGQTYVAPKRASDPKNQAFQARINLQPTPLADTAAASPPILKLGFFFHSFLSFVLFVFGYSSQVLLVV